MEQVTLAHGAGGTQTAALIREVFASAFDNPLFTHDDAAVLPAEPGRLAFTTDSFVVSPAFFPGGNVGRLAVCGTVNDLACMGAQPLYLSCAFVIEEGLEVAVLREIVRSMAEVAREAGVCVVAGDTKVVARGECDGVFITTSGVGRVPDGVSLSGAFAREGDAVLLSGDVGRHGAAILAARGSFGFETDVTSDCAPLHGLAHAMLEATQGHGRCLRDATRGGVATVLHELCGQSGVGMELDEEAIPVSEPVSGICGLLGLEPLYLACEGRLVCVVPEEQAQTALSALRGCRYGERAAIVGRVTKRPRGAVGAVTGVVMRTSLGGLRSLPPPTGELLPRIC